MNSDREIEILEKIISRTKKTFAVMLIVFGSITFMYASSEARDFGTFEDFVSEYRASWDEYTKDTSKAEQTQDIQQLSADFINQLVNLSTSTLEHEWSSCWGPAAAQFINMINHDVVLVSMRLTTTTLYTGTSLSDDAWATQFQLNQTLTQSFENAFTNTDCK